MEHAIAFDGELAIIVSPLITPRAVPRDADDDHVIAAALAAGADLVVSGDANLLSMGTYEGIPIVSAAEAVKRVEATPKRCPRRWAKTRLHERVGGKDKT